MSAVNQYDLRLLHRTRELLRESSFRLSKIPMQEHYKLIAKQGKLIANAYARLEKCKSSYDRATSLQDIERKKHELHCLCVECGVAAYEEYRYGDKKIHTDDFHEQLVLFRKPKI